MLILEAEITFTDEHLSHNLSTKNILRPAFNFGNNLLFSGTIIAEEGVEELKLNENYSVFIEMPTIEAEAYQHIRDFLFIGNFFGIQKASRVLGSGKILDFVYEDGQD